MAALLTSAARFLGKPEVAALASRVQQGLMFKSVGRGFIDGQAHAEPEAAHASSAAEVRECWHLRAEDHSRLVTESLLPLASLHAAAVMAAPSIRQLSEGAGSDIASSTSTQAAKWSAASAVAACQQARHTKTRLRLPRQGSRHMCASLVQDRRAGLQ